MGLWHLQLCVVHLPCTGTRIDCMLVLCGSISYCAQAGKQMASSIALGTFVMLIIAQYHLDPQFMWAQLVHFPNL